MAKYTRRIGICFSLFAACLACLGGGCKKAPSGGTTDNGAAAPQNGGEALARVHWLGMKRLTSQPSAAYLMSIWTLPQSKRLEEQTIGKLALALGNGWPGNSNWLAGLTNPAANGLSPSNATVALLGPLLEDLVEVEAYAEVRQAAGQPGELALAMRLTEERARSWETNLLVALESITGARPVAAQAQAYGWQLEARTLTPASSPDGTTSNGRPGTHLFTLARAGEWTIVGFAEGTNALAHDFAARIRHESIPFVLPPTNFWLDASVDFRKVATALGLDWKVPEAMPKVSLRAIGNADLSQADATGEHVRMSADLDFPKPLSLDLEPWKVPTNFISGPLYSFTALRGIGPWLSSCKAWTDLAMGPPPNQIFFWGQPGMPYLSYGAAPLSTSNSFARATERLLQEGNQWMRSNGVGSFAIASNAEGLIWKGHPFLTPYLKRAASGNSEVALWGLGGKPVPEPQPLPSELLREVTGRANLVYYDWELTGPRLDEWTYLGQMLRRMFRKSHMSPDSAGTAWLQAIESRLGNCGTMITAAGPNRLRFLRNGSLGLCSVELELLADWLESPQFPHGFHSLLAPEPTVPLTDSPFTQTRTNAGGWTPVRPGGK